MNILYIWDADYPWDVRVEKVCETLKNNGHEIHIASRNLKRNPELEIINGIHVHRLKGWENKNINYILSFPLFFSPVWTVFIHKIIQQYDIKIIIVRDLPMSIAGIWAGKKYRIPVIFDMAEDYVSMLRDIWKTKKYQGINLIARNPYLAKYVESYAFKKSDHIFVVVDEAINVVKKGGGIGNNTTVVCNTPNINSFAVKDNVVVSEEIEKIRKEFSVIYTGGVQMGRGIQTVLKAIPSIIQHIPNFRFVIVGDGYARSVLEGIAKEEGIENHVKWVGWINHRDIFKYIMSCKAGIIPHLVSEHVNTTIPNKIFDYMGCGIPVICSDAAPLKRIVIEEKCGLVYKGGDHVSLAKAVCDLYEKNTEYGENGRKSVMKKYNWIEDEKRLLNVINQYRNS